MDAEFSCKCNPGRTENTNVVANVVARAQETGYKAGYIEYLTHVNVVSEQKFTDEQCALRAVDTEVVM
ncbi:hypothetical protein Hanom_Chr07g00658011 [Helianthus anomalus]